MAQEAKARSLLSVDALSVEFSTPDGRLKALDGVDLTLQPGETVGIAGESGSGKSTLALAILQYLDENGRISAGSVSFDGADLTSMSARGLRRIRGNRIAHVPQDPERSLNPSLPIGVQITETIRTHQDVSKREARERTIDILAQVNLSDPEYNVDRYPHELSGGMQQRVLLAMALSCNPELLILDEPTTGLDVTTQAKILDLIGELKETFDTSIILITHDLGVVAEVADRVVILYAGRVMERGSVDDVFTAPAHPYTQRLIAAIPSIDERKELLEIPGRLPDLTAEIGGCIFADRCEFAEPACRDRPIVEERVATGSAHVARCRRWEHVVATGVSTTRRHDPSPATVTRSSEDDTDGGAPLFRIQDLTKYYEGPRPPLIGSFIDREPPVKAVDGVTFDIYRSETLGLVGESGCGKSTLGRTLLGLLESTAGTVRFHDEDISAYGRDEMREFRSECQIVFQNPDSSLNPKRTVYAILRRPIELFTDLDGDGIDRRIAELLEDVALGRAYAARYPHELSGGEKQRVAIARAFAANPSFVVLDEPVSALDVSVQAGIIRLLQDLRDQYGVSYLFISHDLSVVRHLCDRIAVMYLGRLVEIGANAEIFEPPYHPYTRALLSSIPSTDPAAKRDRIHLEGAVPSARHPPSGCPFHTRCPNKIGEVCEQETPQLEPKTDSVGHRISCHLELEAMAQELGR